MQNIFYVFIGGGLGAVCRYLTTTKIGAIMPAAFPCGTFFVNTLGSFLMGLIMGILLPLAAEGQLMAESARLFLTVGFLGGFTTFSSFSLETLTLFEGGQCAMACLNIIGSITAGILAALLGLSLARLFSL